MRLSDLLGRRGLSAAPLALALAIAVAAPVSAATLSSGHVDILDVDAAGGALTLNIKTYGAGANDNVAPGSTTFVVPSAALSTVPSGSSYTCLGSAGSSVYLLPQSETAATSLGLLWAGWNTEGVSSPSTVNLVIDVAGSTLPTGARFAIYTTSLGTATFRLNTNSASGCTKTSFSVSKNVHGHGFWAFTKSGTYVIKMRATGSGVTASAWQNFTFVVG